jgi:hypothetical protein
VISNHFEEVDNAIYLVSECPGGAIQYSAIVRAFFELRYVRIRLFAQPTFPYVCR